MSKIFVSKMYQGSFAEDNIGGEIINFLKTDDGRNFVFVNPYGFLGQKHNADDADAILFVRNRKDLPNTKEVVACAKVKPRSEDFDSAMTSHNCVAVKHFIEKSAIKYGGVLLSDLLFLSDKAVPLSFEAEKLMKPNKPLILTSNDDYENANADILHSSKQIDGQASHLVFDSTEDEKTYSELKSYIDNEELWSKIETQTFAELKASGKSPYSVDSNENSSSMWQKLCDKIAHQSA